jgi:glycyl-tRNA synthetase (class II)
MDPFSLLGKVTELGSSFLAPSDAEVSYGVQDHLPEEVKQVIERCAPNVARVDYKESSKFGQRYKCYDERGVFIGRVKYRHGTWSWEKG